MLLASFSCRLNLCPGIGRTSSRRGNTRGQSFSDLYPDGEIHPVTDPVSLVGGDQVIFADRQVSNSVVSDFFLNYLGFIKSKDIYISSLVEVFMETRSSDHILLLFCLIETQEKFSFCSFIKFWILSF